MTPPSRSCGAEKFLLCLLSYSPEVAGLLRRKHVPGIFLKDGAVSETHEYVETDSTEMGVLSNKTSEQLRSKRLMRSFLTFPVLLKVGFLMAGTLGAGRRGRSGAPPAMGSGLEDSWSLRSVAFRASPGAPATHQ